MRVNRNALISEVSPNTAGVSFIARNAPMSMISRGPAVSSIAVKSKITMARRRTVVIPVAVIVAITFVTVAMSVVAWFVVTMIFVVTVIFVVTMIPVSTRVSSIHFPVAIMKSVSGATDTERKIVSGCGGNGGCDSGEGTDQKRGQHVKRSH